MDKAACAGTHTEVFYPPDGMQGYQKRAWEKVAKSICVTCPVVLECRKHAVENNEEGIWGATTGDERKGMKQPAPPKPRACRRCQRPMVSQLRWYNGDRPEGHVRIGAHEVCIGCYEVVRREAVA
jgi:WhiB family redox-sensing transcriptional regulator